MTETTISAQGITIDGNLTPAEYSKSPSGSVFAFVRLNDQALRIKFDPSDAHYSEALSAWEASYQGKPAVHEPAPEAQPTQEEPEEFSPEWWQEAQADEAPDTQPATAEATQADDAPDAQPATEPAPAAMPAAQPRPAGETVEKLWIGTSLKGKGWEIYFDPEYSRTRVIFKRKPHEAARQAVKDAGFFWCPSMKSWNKKLTCKAFRAAQALALELGQLCS